jgi:hypothetical protein
MRSRMDQQFQIVEPLMEMKEEMERNRVWKRVDETLE